MRSELNWTELNWTDELHCCVSGMASGFGHGHLIQSHSVGEHGRWATRKVSRMPSPRPLRQSLSYKRLSQRVGSLPGQLYQQPRYKHIHYSYYSTNSHNKLPKLSLIYCSMIKVVQLSQTYLYLSYLCDQVSWFCSSFDVSTSNLFYQYTGCILHAYL